MKEEIKAGQIWRPKWYNIDRTTCYLIRSIDPITRHISYNKIGQYDILYYKSESLFLLDNRFFQ